MEIRNKHIIHKSRLWKPNNIMTESTIQEDIDTKKRDNIDVFLSSKSSTGFLLLSLLLMDTKWINTIVR